MIKYFQVSLFRPRLFPSQQLTLRSHMAPLYAILSRHPLASRVQSLGDAVPTTFFQNRGNERMILLMRHVTKATLGAALVLSVASAEQPQVTIESRILQDKVHSFVTRITEGEVASFADPLVVWRKPVCPLVAGLPVEQGHLVFDRLTAVMNRVGTPLGVTGCRPNFFVVATAEPESVLNGVWNRRFKAFGNASPTLIKRFIETPRPVRIWYSTEPTSADGGPIGTTIPASNLTGSQFDGVPTYSHDGNGLRHNFVVTHSLSAVVAVIDLTMVAGLDWGRVTDYVAMAGLIQIDLDANLDATPSILRLFTTPGNPAGLTDWDVAFLKGVNRTDPVSFHQRWAISQQMVEDLSH